MANVVIPIKPNMRVPGVNQRHPLAYRCLGAWNFQYPNVITPDAMGLADAVGSAGIGVSDWVGSPYGYAVSTPGTVTGNYVIPSSVLSRVENASVSVSVLFNPGDLLSFECICDTGTAGGEREIALFIDTATSLFVNFGGNSGGGLGITLSPGIRENEWQHLLLTFDNSRPTKHQCYIDGQLNGTQTSGGDTTFGRAITIGSSVSAANLHFTGEYGHFAIYQGTVDDFAIELGRDPFAPFRQSFRADRLFVEPSVGGLSIPIAYHHYQRNTG